MVLTWNDLKAALTMQRQTLLEQRSDYAAGILQRFSDLGDTTQAPAEVLSTNAFAYTAASGERSANATQLRILDRLIDRFAMEAPQPPDKFGGADFHFVCAPWCDAEGKIDWPCFYDNARKQGHYFGAHLETQSLNREYLAKQARQPIWGVVPAQELPDMFAHPGFKDFHHQASVTFSGQTEHALKVFFKPRDSAPDTVDTFYGNLLWYPNKKQLVIESVKTPPSMQRQGCLKNFLAGTVQLAKRIGAERIELCAGEHDGPLVWAKAGIHVGDRTKSIGNLHGDGVEYHGWASFCDFTRDCAEWGSRNPAASPERQSLFARVAALTQNNASKENLQQIAGLYEDIAAQPGQRLPLAYFNGYFDLGNAAQMQGLGAFIGREISPEAQPHGKPPSPSGALWQPK